MLRARVVREIRSLRGNVDYQDTTFARQVRGVGNTRKSMFNQGTTVGSITKTKS
jgi:hypothetical protein